MLSECGCCCDGDGELRPKITYLPTVGRSVVRAKLGEDGAAGHGAVGTKLGVHFRRWVADWNWQCHY